MGFLTNLFNGAAAHTDTAVDAAEARQRQQAGALLIDVREPMEWREGHAHGAKHIPLGSLPTRLSELPTDREILTICRSGNRSSRAQQFLLANGYSKVLNVNGGMMAWTRANLPVKR